MKRIFIGPNGIRAGWRLLIFLGVVAALIFAIGTVLRFADPSLAAAARRSQASGQLRPLTSGVFEAVVLLVLALAAWIMSKIEGRPMGTYGLPRQGAFRGLFWRGTLWGFVAISTVLLAIFAFHGFNVVGLATHGSALAAAFVLWGVTFLAVGLTEEFAFRGYAQYTLTTGMGFWPAAILLSCGFAAVHLGNHGESPMGIASVALFALVFCVILRRTGNLWWCVGFHASWDWGETFFYGVPDSGVRPWHSFLQTTLSGPVWLSGGNTGPEASIFTLIALIVVGVLIARAYPRNRYPTDTAPFTSMR